MGRKREGSPEGHHRSQRHLHISGTAGTGASESGVKRLRDKQHDVVARRFFSELTRRAFGQSNMEGPQPLHRKLL
jgi:hypothetical protein